MHVLVYFWRWWIIKTSFFYKLVSFFILWCDDKLLLSKLYLHGIYYNVIGQDPNHDTLINIANILFLNDKKYSLYLVTMLGNASLSSWIFKKLMEREERKSWSTWKDSKNDYFGGELVITYSNLLTYYEQDMEKSIIFLDYYNNVYQKWYENR